MFSQPITLFSEFKIERMVEILKRKPFISKYVHSLDMGFWSLLSIQHQRKLFQHIVHFKNLKTPKLTSAIHHYLADVDAIIQSYPRLKSLSLVLKDITLPQPNEDDFQDWMLENVQPSSSVDVIRVKGASSHAGLVEYLLYKYPNVSSAYVWYVKDVSTAAMQRILNRLQAIPHVDIGNWLLEDDVVLVKNICSKLRSTNNFVTLRRCDNELASGGTIVMKAHKNQQKDYTYFDVTMSEKSSPHILAMVNKTLGGSGVLDIDYQAYPNMLRIGHDIQDTFTFDRFFNLISVARRVWCNDAHIPYFHLPAGNPMAPSLEELALCGGIIDGRVLTILDQVAPNLKHLRLHTCVLGIRYTQHFSVLMPSSDLDCLSIITQATTRYTAGNSYNDVILGASDARNNTLWDYDGVVRVKKWQKAALLVNTLSSVQYFVLKPGPPTTICRAVSEGDYAKFACEEIPVYIIECKSLKTLKLKLGALALDLKIDQKRPIESVEDWLTEGWAYPYEEEVY